MRNEKAVYLIQIWLHCHRFESYLKFLNLNKMTALILISIYALSTLRNHRWVKKAYSKDGRWAILDTNMMDLFVVFMPFVNTVAAIMCLFNSPYHKGYKKPRNYNKLFNIEK